MTESVELVFIPCTARGHLAVTLEFAKLVVGRDDRLSVTVIIPKSLHDPSLAAHVDSLVASFSQSQCIKFVLVANDYVSAEDTTSPIVAVSRVAESLKVPIRNHVNERICGSGIHLAGFVVDVLLLSVADVADDFGVPTYVFWTASAGFLGLNLHLSQLRDDNENAVEVCGDSESLDVSGFSKPVPTHALPAELFDSEFASILFSLTSGLRKAKGVVLNASIEIEPNAIHSLLSSGNRSPPVYPVGPVLNLASTYSGADGNDIMKWLDGQSPSSVIFLCFGSFGCFSPEQIKEIAFALESSGLRFLWTLQVPPSTKGESTWTSVTCEDPAAILPQGFLERTANVGRVIEWAPQAAVLAHPAVGGFVSHCGWNSVLESVWFGVPVAAWPLYAEQRLNAFELVTELGLSVAVKPGCKIRDEAAPVSAEEIEAAMRSVMEGRSEVRKGVKEASEKFRKAVMEGGSSVSWLDSFVNDVFESLQLHQNP